MRIYRGSIHAYEPYEFGREENLLWLHLVKLAAEVVISTLKELPNDDRRPFQEQVSHISQDLKLVMERREQGDLPLPVPAPLPVPVPLPLTERHRRKHGGLERAAAGRERGQVLRDDAPHVVGPVRAPGPA